MSKFTMHAYHLNIHDIVLFLLREDSRYIISVTTHTTVATFKNKRCYIFFTSSAPANKFILHQCLLLHKPFVNSALKKIIWQGFVAALLCGLATMVCGGGDTPTVTDATDLAQCKIETGI